MPSPAADAASDGVFCAPWPAWLESARVNDSLMGAAYEATAPRFRAALKTALALAQFHFGESPARWEEARYSGRLGFRRAAFWSPAPWALIVFSPAYAAAARLTAVCAAAQLAGVPLLGAVCPGGGVQAPALVSLELSGVEDVFAPDAAGVDALPDTLAARAVAPGRVVLLHAGDLDALAQRIRARGLTCYEERRPPHLRIEPGADIDRELLAFAHGGAAALDAALAEAGPPDAVYCSADDAARPASDAPLTLCPGCEGFWLHPDLGPDFFTLSRQAFAPWAAPAGTAS